VRWTVALTPRQHLEVARPQDDDIGKILVAHARDQDEGRHDLSVRPLEGFERRDIGRLRCCHALGGAVDISHETLRRVSGTRPRAG
jgi:hypothetical protein